MAARWLPSLTVSTHGWQPGDYLLRLDANSGRQGFVPMTVRATSAKGRVVLISPVTTWQAYNVWGCCDLYAGSDGSFASRARVVSFDRPYAKEFGAGQFLRDELGVVAEAERIGLPLDYITDIDLQADPHILDGARAAVSMGHDEYYSPQMRAVLEAARGRGINLAFFGANAIYRRIRFASSTLGPLRLEINYKVATEDPLYGVDNSAVTADWPSYPAARPESSLIGAQYGCYFGLVSNVPGVVSKPRSWLFAGVHVIAGEVLPGLIGPEIDSIRNGYPPPPGPVDVIMRSPARCPYSEPTTADTTYYTARSGAGVFDAATIGWACVVGPKCAGLSNQRTHAVVRQVTDNILRKFAVGPAGRSHPS